MAKYTCPAGQLHPIKCCRGGGTRAAICSGTLVSAQHFHSNEEKYQKSRGDCSCQSMWQAAHPEDAGAGSLCNAQGDHSQLGHLEQAHVVCDRAYEHCCLVLLQHQSNSPSFRSALPAKSLLATSPCQTIDTREHLLQLNNLWLRKPHSREGWNGADRTPVLTLPFMKVASLDRDRGGLFVLDMNSRLRTTLLNLLSVRLTRNVYSCTQPAGEVSAP